MNICNIQKEYIKEQILNNLVKKGIEPTVYEVNNLINDYFLNYEKGHCIFKPLDIKNYTISNKDEYNKAFKNLNIDLISSVPGQTVESFCRTLQKAVSLSPEHLSVYSLILEAGTEFYRRRNELVLPDEDTVLRIDD